MLKKTHYKRININQPLQYRARHKAFAFLQIPLSSLLFRLTPWLASKMFRPFVIGRFVELPFVLLNIGSIKIRILDVGCYGNIIPLQLASLGYEVYAIDVQKYYAKHPNLNVIQGDITQTSFPDDFFDVITAVSTIEHIGLTRYGDPAYKDGDKKAMAEIFRILKVGGRVIMTVPFGERNIFYHKNIPSHRTYDLPSLKELFSEFEIEKMEFVLKKEGIYHLTLSVDEAYRNYATGDGDYSWLKAIALVVALKKTRQGKANLAEEDV